jgi:hypothetical protein
MATYALFFGPPKGQMLLHKKHRKRVQAERVLGIDDRHFADLCNLGLLDDPYRTHTWDGQELAVLKQQIDEALTHFPASMFLLELLAMVHLAIERNGTIVCLGD